MKKVISLLLVVVLVSGCGKSSVLPSSDVLSLSKLPPPIPPPAITSYDDISKVKAYNMTFWDKVQLIAEPAIGIIWGVFLCYDIVVSEREQKRFDERCKRAEEREKRRAECDKVRQRSKMEEQKRHAGHQVNHPGYHIGSS